MNSKSHRANHIFQQPYQKDNKWFLEKTFLGERAGFFSADTKEEIDEKLRKLLRLHLSINENFIYEYEQDGTFYYLTQPSLDSSTKTYSFSIKKMSNREVVSFLDDFETIVQAIQRQKKITGTEVPQIIEVPVKRKRGKSTTTRKKITVRKHIELNATKQLEILIYIRGAMFEGFSIQEIRQEVLTTYGEIAEEDFKGLLDSAKLFYKNAIVDSQDIPGIIQSHITHYEHIYKYFNETGNVIGANKAMYAKERLLGLHTKQNIVEMNQENNFNIQPLGYDYSLLNQQEQNALNSYLLKIS